MWQVRERAGDLAISLVLCGVGIYWVVTAHGMPPGEFNFDMAPLIMAVVLGDKIEMSFRRALTISEGSLRIFAASSFSAVFLGAAVLILGLQLAAWLLGFRVRDGRKG